MVVYSVNSNKLRFTVSIFSKMTGSNVTKLYSMFYGICVYYSVSLDPSWFIKHSGSKHMSTMPYRDDQLLQPHEPSTLILFVVFLRVNQSLTKLQFAHFCGGIPLPLLMPYSYFELLAVLQMRSMKVYVFSKFFLKLVYLISAHLLF